MGNTQTYEEGGRPIHSGKEPLTPMHLAFTFYVTGLLDNEDHLFAIGGSNHEAAKFEGKLAALYGLTEDIMNYIEHVDRTGSDFSGSRQIVLETRAAICQMQKEQSERTAEIAGQERSGR